jgi:hypothetical protein
VSHPGAPTQAMIDELVRSTGATDAFEAIRLKARELTSLFVATFGDPETPIDVDVLASLRGIQRSSEPPVLSEDAELVPDGVGGVQMRVNPDRPETRQRFSIAHEISHTFFPEYSSKSWCRTDARYRDRQNPEELLEMLCDVGAAELLFPLPWFGSDAAKVKSGNELMKLAARYNASRDATIRRLAEVSVEPIAAVFFSWKLKPTQKPTIGNRSQSNLFGESADERIRDAMKLRIEYTITSSAFRTAGHFLPNDKSVPNEGPVYQAALTGIPTDGEYHFDFGQASGKYMVWAIPLWTSNEQLGAKGENAVAALLTPLSVQRPRNMRRESGKGRSLFGDC